MHTLYLLRNTMNGKLYIGQTRQSVAVRFGQHSRAKSIIGQAIRKYGQKVFAANTLFSDLTQDEANFYERFYISLYRSLGYTLYNIAEGGDAGQGIGEPVREKIRAAAKRKWERPGEREKASAGQRKRFERQEERDKHRNPAQLHTAETRRKVLETMATAAYRQRRSELARRISPYMTPIRCIETGIVYPSYSEAARQIGTDSSNISRHIKGKASCAKGLHFERLTNGQ